MCKFSPFCNNLDVFLLLLANSAERPVEFNKDDRVLIVPCNAANSSSKDIDFTGDLVGGFKEDDRDSVVPRNTVNSSSKDIGLISSVDVASKTVTSLL